MPKKHKIKNSIENRKKILIKEFNNKNLNFKLVTYNDIFKSYKEEISDVLLLNFSTEVLYDNFFKTFDKVDNEFKKVLIIKSFKKMEQTVRFKTIFDLLKSSEIEKNLIFIIDVIDLSFNDFLRNYEFNNLVFEINELIKDIRLKNKKEITNIEKRFLLFYQKHIEIMEYSKQSQFKIEIPKLPNTLIDSRINIFEYFNGALNIIFQNINNRNNLKIKEESLCNEKYYLTKSLNKLNVKQLDRIHLETRLAYLNDFFFNNIYKGIDDIAKRVNSIIWDYSTNFKEMGFTEEEGILLRTYLAKSSVNLFIFKNIELSANYICLFFEKIGKIKSNYSLNDDKIKVGLDFVFGDKNSSEKDILKSFLTKDDFGFDLRSVLVHSMGINIHIPCALSLYFFSFLSKFYCEKKYYNKAYPIKDCNEKLIPSSESLSLYKKKWEHKEINNHYAQEISKYYAIGDQTSLFIHNIIELEYYLSNNVKNSYIFNKEGFVHHKLLHDLLIDFNLEKSGQIKDVISDLKSFLLLGEDAGMNLRTHIMHGNQITEKELIIVKRFNLQYYYLKMFQLI